VEQTQKLAKKIFVLKTKLCGKLFILSLFPRYLESVSQLIRNPLWPTASAIDVGPNGFSLHQYLLVVSSPDQISARRASLFHSGYPRQ